MEDRITRKYKTAGHYVLASLIPYTESNLTLVFLPKVFFEDLSKIEHYNKQSLRNAYHRLIKKGMVELDENNQPVITNRGLRELAPYRSKELPNSKIMIIFDVQEAERNKRQQLRTLLRQLKFTQVQKSVWTSKYDSRNYIHSEIKRLNLADNVKLFECRSL